MAGPSRKRAVGTATAGANAPADAGTNPIGDSAGSAAGPSRTGKDPANREGTNPHDPPSGQGGSSPNPPEPGEKENDDRSNRSSTSNTQPTGAGQPAQVTGPTVPPIGQIGETDAQRIERELTAQALAASQATNDPKIVSDLHKKMTAVQTMMGHMERESEASRSVTEAQDRVRDLQNQLIAQQSVLQTATTMRAQTQAEMRRIAQEDPAQYAATLRNLEKLPAAGQGLAYPPVPNIRFPTPVPAGRAITNLPQIWAGNPGESSQQGMSTVTGGQTQEPTSTNMQVDHCGFRYESILYRPNYELFNYMSSPTVEQRKSGDWWKHVASNTEELEPHADLEGRLHFHSTLAYFLKTQPESEEFFRALACADKARQDYLARHRENRAGLYEDWADLPNRGVPINETTGITCSPRDPFHSKKAAGESTIGGYSKRITTTGESS
ncbi:hypothetical protein SISNIDRAFT_490707 [Sistotremastrum niveocremeum HHB9708]|uniref:Uncharacterized protein n=1 Tax=Sistotremastrum niveocremeum HHB9708 TaxID=1314777 RepID=A0A164NIE7_9AGAM|nr:hypothetical protein SISNIDRAFT_490707 [Sistotremastrum niveocremeum HHB9708]